MAARCHSKSEKVVNYKGDRIRTQKVCLRFLSNKISPNASWTCSSSRATTRQYLTRLKNTFTFDRLKNECFTPQIFSSHVSKFLRHFSGKQLQENCPNLKLWLKRTWKRKSILLLSYFQTFNYSWSILSSYCAMWAAKSNNYEILATREKSYIFHMMFP